VDTDRLETGCTEAGVLKKLSLAGIAKLSRLKYSRLRVVWPQPIIVESELKIGWCTHAADSTEQYETPGVSMISLAERG
jgi:hypothetical protein